MDPVESLSQAPQKISLSGLQPGGSGFSGSPQGGGFAGSPRYGSIMPGQIGGPDLLQLILASQASAPGAGGANLAGLLTGLGQTSLGAGNIGQQPGGLIAGDTSGGGSFSQPSGTIAGQGSGTSVDPASIIAKIFGIGKSLVGLASPMQGAGDLGMQADIAGSDPAAAAAQRASERTASPTFDLASASPFQIPAGILTGQSGGSVAGSNIGDFTQLTPAQVQDLLLQQQGAGLYTGAGPGAGVGATNTLSQGAGGGGAAPGQGSSSLSGSNLGQGLGQAAGGLGVGSGLYNIIQALQKGNIPGVLPGGLQTAQGLLQLLQNSPELAKSLPQGIQDFLGQSAAPGGSATGGVGGVAAILSAIGGLTGNKDISSAAGALSGIPSAALVASQIPALAGSEALAALSANPYTAAIAAAISQIMTLYGDIQSGASGESTFLQGLVAPIPIVGGIASQAIDKAFRPSEAYQSFPGRVEQTAALEQEGLSALLRGLPYVQSQQELANALKSFESLVGLQVGGYGTGSDPFTVPALPEVGTETHGVRTTPTSFAPQTALVQSLINALRPNLPAAYTGPDMGDSYMRDFGQFLNRRDIAPQQAGTPAFMSMSGGEGGPVDVPTGGSGVLMYGDPGYNYAASGFPMPGQFAGSINPLWQALGLPNITPCQRRW
jgi:hypothetical protein